MVNTILAPYLSVIEEISPAKTPAKKEAIVQSPISTPASLTGDNLLTTESPTGDKQSSPMV